VNGFDAGFDDAFRRKIERLALITQNRKIRRRRVGLGLDFVDHREYVPGDDLRRLDWNLFGRLSRPLVRVFEEDQDLPIHLLVDRSASMGLGAPAKLRLGLQTAVALAYVGLAAGDQVAVRTLGRDLDPGYPIGRGTGRIHRILAQLDAVTPEGGTDLGQAVRSFLRPTPRPGVLVLISDLFDTAGYEDAIARLKHAHFDVAIIQIFAPVDEGRDIPDEAILVDAETGRERWVSNLSAIRSAYDERFARRRSHVLTFCKRRAIRYFEIPCTMPFETLALRILRVRGALG
jgi:uncharacterized protein (DUF58 family)